MSAVDAPPDSFAKRPHSSHLGFENSIMLMSQSLHPLHGPLGRDFFRRRIVLARIFDAAERTERRDDSLRFDAAALVEFFGQDRGCVVRQ